MYDLIGDIHGHADELTALLSELGYHADRWVFTHPRRKVIFLGDYIDRGPQIRQVLEIVRGMCDRGIEGKPRIQCPVLRNGAPNEAGRIPPIPFDQERAATPEIARSAFRC